MLRPVGISPLLGLLVMITSAVSTARGASPVIDFNRDIRPLLTEHCYACHGPDAKQRQGGADQSGGLRFDKRESAVAPLGEERYAIVAGDPQRSEMIQRIWSTDDSQLMPPADYDHPLSPA
ncbi:MAG: hypothetical protein KDA51_04210, partial [Planctomycetales bacterium]|nr:hypothetical protein [Planctomycetales bacterium]